MSHLKLATPKDTFTIILPVKSGSLVCAITNSMFTISSKMPDCPKFFATGSAAVKNIFRVDDKVVHWEWSHQEMYSVLHMLVNYINATELYIEKHMRHEPNSEVEADKKDQRFVADIIYEIKNQAERQGFQLNDEMES